MVTFKHLQNIAHIYHFKNCQNNVNITFGGGGVLCKTFSFDEALYKYLYTREGGVELKMTS